MTAAHLPPALPGLRPEWSRLVDLPGRGTMHVLERPAQGEGQTGGEVDQPRFAQGMRLLDLAHDELPAADWDRVCAASRMGKAA